MSTRKQNPSKSCEGTKLKDFAEESKINEQIITISKADFFNITAEIYKAVALLGAKSDLLGTIASWKDTLEDNDVLYSIKCWNEVASIELKNRLACANY